MSSAERDLRRMIRKLNLTGATIIVVLIGGIGGRAATARIAGAVIAPGAIVVEANVKKVQHPTGGVVGEILVKEDDEVKAGQIVLRLDDTHLRNIIGHLDDYV
jgi:HlyD family secretion protein